MSELQGPRIPGEERSRRRRPVAWIIGGLIALFLLALLIPFACQALRGGSDAQGGGSGAQERTGAQGADDVQGGGDARGANGGENTGNTGAGENARAEPTGGDGSRDGEEAAADAARAAGSGTQNGEKTPPRTRRLKDRRRLAGNRRDAPRGPACRWDGLAASGHRRSLRGSAPKQREQGLD
jgi:hypothetical protein